MAQMDDSKHNYVPVEDEDSFTPIDVLGLPSRLLRLLRTEQVISVEPLELLGYRRVLAMPSMNRKNTELIADAMTRKGYQFDRPPNPAPKERKARTKIPHIDPTTPLFDMWNLNSRTGGN